MSYLRPGRGGESRRSVFYTQSSHSAEEWELVDAPPKDFPEQKHHPDTHRRTFTPCCLILRFHSPEKNLLHSFAQYYDKRTNTSFFHNASSCSVPLSHFYYVFISPLSDSFGSAFAFDFARNSSRTKRPLLMGKGSGRFGRSAETRSAENSPVECNGSKPFEMQLRLQSQQEELSRMQQEQAKLREELASQKVQ